MFQNVLNFISNNKDAIDTICTIFLVIPVGILIYDKINSKKPKITINFELIRSSLACIVIHNYGDTAAELHSLTFNEEFLLELDKDVAKHLLTIKNTKIYLAPGQKWIINFKTNIFNIINDFQNKECQLTYTFSNPMRKHKYKDVNNINFDNYSYFTLYTSELGEINNTLGKFQNDLKKVLSDKKISDAENKISTETADLKNKFTNQ